MIGCLQQVKVNLILKGHSNNLTNLKVNLILKGHLNNLTNLRTDCASIYRAVSKILHEPSSLMLARKHKNFTHFGNLPIPSSVKKVAKTHQKS